METAGLKQQEMIIPRLQKITLAFDSSPNSFEACEAAGIIAKGYGAEVTVVYALPHVRTLSTPLRIYYDANLEKTEIDSIEGAKSSLISFEGVRAKSEILHSEGSISESLIKYIEDEKSDLVISGTRGLGGFKRMLVGSVSSHLVSHSPSPVMVVRKHAEKLELKRMLVATDGSESALRAERLTTSIAKAIGAKLTFVNVVYLPPTAYPIDGTGFDKIMNDLKQAGNIVTTRAASFAKDNGVEADAKTLDEFQSPVMALTRLAEKENYDLIALGTRGLGGFRRLALGSVASGVVHYAHCSVLIAK
jgi:nucleotide-binding universal stress UspA family protein